MNIFKLYLFVFCSMMLTENIHTQTFEPSQANFNFNGNNQYLSADSSYFQQKEFIIGYHWGATPKISKALISNQRDASFETPNSRDYLDSCYIFLRPVGNTHFVDASILNARGIQYEPTLELDKSNPTKLVKRIGDTTRPVFGFLNRRGRIPTNPIDTNFNRLIIDSISLVNQVILSEPWPCNQLHMFGFNYNTSDDRLTIIDTFLGRWMFLSINLRRFDNLPLTDTILKIELPYTVGGGGGNNIQFA